MIPYWSVCSGIEAASCAWQPMNDTFKPVLFSETDPFCSAVLQHHYPGVTNYGDITQHADWPDRPCELLVGGTPCQPFSTAGPRKGRRDPRNAPTTAFLEVVSQRQPLWIIWENVPAVLKMDRGDIFADILAQLAVSGYGFSWRVLDALGFGVPQRRKRLFLVAHRSGDWRGPCEVLFGQAGGAGADEPLPAEAEAVPVGFDAAPYRAGPEYALGEDGRRDCVGTLTCKPNSNEFNYYTNLVVEQDGRIRRLTPDECEALQGFPRGWTAIEWRGRPASDHQRYRAVGNAIAVPVLAHLGRRLAAVHYTHTHTHTHTQ